MTTGELCRGPAWRVCHTCHNLSHVSAARVTARMPIVIGFVTRVTRVTPVTGGFGGRQVFVVWAEGHWCPKNPGQTRFGRSTAVLVGDRAHEALQDAEADEPPSHQLHWPLPVALVGLDARCELYWKRSHRRSQAV